MYLFSFHRFRHTTIFSDNIQNRDLSRSDGIIEEHHKLTIQHERIPIRYKHKENNKQAKTEKLYEGSICKCKISRTQTKNYTTVYLNKLDTTAESSR